MQTLPTYKEPEEVLKAVFGYDSFRPFQREVISSVLSRRDTLAIMPTGGGKSLCYQIPALIFPNLTIVISPLIALMQDQVSSLVENGVGSVFLNSSLDWDGYRKAASAICSGSVKLLYVSPEGLHTQHTKELLHSSGVIIDCITIDEAHCISEWGHDFRPDYMDIAPLRHEFGDPVFLALTATATKQVMEDIAQNLHMKNPSVFISSFNRENIFLEVKQKRNALVQTLECISAHKGESGIVYCASRREVDTLTHEICSRGYLAANYHAGLSDQERAEHQDMFVKGRVFVIVATVAFGMGINVPNVRFVIHYDMPKSIEQYYQEIGRAGRDGLPSYALLLFSTGDAHKIRYFFRESADKSKAETLLQAMIKYATSRTCRRKSLLSYFGENASEGNGGKSCCDVCANGTEEGKDVTIPAQKLLSCIIRTGGRFGAGYVIDVLLGSKAKRIAENRHDKLSTWGIGSDIKRGDWLELADCMIEAGLICKTGDYNVLSVTRKGRTALSSRQAVVLPVHFGMADKKAAPVSKRIDTGDTEALRIADALKAWRRCLADKENVPPYVIFGDKTVFDIARKKPVTKQALLNVYGIGEVKAEKFGDDILRIVRGK